MEISCYNLAQLKKLEIKAFGTSNLVENPTITEILKKYVMRHSYQKNNLYSKPYFLLTSPILF